MFLICLFTYRLHEYQSRAFGELQGLIKFTFLVIIIQWILCAITCGMYLDLFKHSVWQFLRSTAAKKNFNFFIVITFSQNAC